MIDLQSIKTQLEPLFVKHGIVRVIVFGSYAKGTATENSDIDMVIDSAGFLRGINFFTARADFALYGHLPAHKKYFRITAVPARKSMR